MTSPKMSHSPPGSTLGGEPLQQPLLRGGEKRPDASFATANELTKAKDLKEALQIQSRHAQLQMHAYVLQAQEFGEQSVQGFRCKSCRGNAPVTSRN